MVKFKVRSKMKTDTTANWALQTEFIPLEGEIIVYSDYAQTNVNGVTVYVPNFKIGDGKAYCVDLPFVSDDIREALAAHLNNTNVHVTAEEKAFWNNKVRCYIDYEEQSEYVVDSENLIFTTA